MKSDDVSVKIRHELAEQGIDAKLQSRADDPEQGIHDKTGMPTYDFHELHGFLTQCRKNTKKSVVDSKKRCTFAVHF